jgi:hypothetical protein
MDGACHRLDGEIKIRLSRALETQLLGASEISEISQKALGIFSRADANKGGLTDAVDTVWRNSSAGLFRCMSTDRAGDLS